MSADEALRAKRITGKLLAWYAACARSFVFRGTRDPYRVWLSEIMLQQTRTETVSPYYERFLRLFPDVFALANAQEREVLKAWEGLGYYTRARNLHRTARLISEAGGVFPDTAEGLEKLPGIGEYAAAAIASIAFDEAVPAMDGNLARVISRLFLVSEDIGLPATRKRLRQLGFSLMPASGAGDMNQALMDLGATVCLPGTPDCGVCPLVDDCLANQAGSQSELPAQQAKKPPRKVDLAVVLVFCGNEVLLLERREALLKGLYVFLLNEKDASLNGAGQALSRYTVDFSGLREIGEARHVFTHRIWQMRLYAARVGRRFDAEGAVWANAARLDSLPLPVAMKAAAKKAREILSGE